MESRNKTSGNHKNLDLTILSVLAVSSPLLDKWYISMRLKDATEYEKQFVCMTHLRMSLEDVFLCYVQHQVT